MDTPYDDVYHQKVASSADTEVILFTKKSTSTTDLKNPLAFLTQKSISSASNTLRNEEEDEAENNVNNARTSRSSPSYVIEFNADNKLEMVPKTSASDKLEKENPSKYSK